MLGSRDGLEHGMVSGVTIEVDLNLVSPADASNRVTRELAHDGITPLGNLLPELGADNPHGGSF